MRDAILVVDDDDDFRSLVVLALQSMAPVLSAPDCRSGLEVVRKEGHRIALVLLDYFMPGMSPPGCSAALRDAVPAGVPIVLCTAAVSAPSRADELQLSLWLGKPFDLNQLRQIVRQALAGTLGRPAEGEGTATAEASPPHS